MKDILRALLISIIIVGMIIIMVYTSDMDGYRRGFKDGVTTTLDSVNTIVNRQLTDKTISSKFLIQSSDTLEFILSPKTIKMK